MGNSELGLSDDELQVAKNHLDLNCPSSPSASALRKKGIKDVRITQNLINLLKRELFKTYSPRDGEEMD